MNRRITTLHAALAAAAAIAAAPDAMAHIDGITGPVFNLGTASGYISTAEGGSVYTWGYTNGAGLMQYPGPTLIVNAGDAVTVNLTNTLPVPVSIVFPGQEGVLTAGGTPGLLTNEAAAGGGTVSYSFVATRPGTFQYHSGTNPQLQIEMGLVGALIVRPAAMMQAYDHPDSAYDLEYLFIETEMDPAIHNAVALGQTPDFSTYWPTYWFLNGRVGTDTMTGAPDPMLPYQPYNCMPMMNPGHRLLMRMVEAGRDFHPFHTHSNHFLVIAQDGQMLSSGPGRGADNAREQFTISVTPGGTADGIFTWTGANLGWDIYGHQSGDPLEPNEYAADHGKPFPVELPPIADVLPGPMYGGSPFLGVTGYLPPGMGTPVNTMGAFFNMWHSHREKELCNNGTFPGGMLTMIVVLPPSIPVMH